MLVHGLKVKQEEDKEHESNDLVTVVLWCYSQLQGKAEEEKGKSNLAFVIGENEGNYRGDCDWFFVILFFEVVKLWIAVEVSTVDLKVV